MELKIKTKIIDGKKVKGLIDENLNEIAEFIYEDILEVTPYKYEKNKKYYICKMKDGSCSLYDYNGNCRISYKEGYEIQNILKFSIDYYFCNSIEIVAKKNAEVGILCAKYDSSSKKCSVDISYAFGKCDEIKEYDNGTVELIKHSKENDLVGYYYHKNIEEIIEPNYLSYVYYILSAKKVGLYELSDGKGKRRKPSYDLSDVAEYDKFTFNAELISYSMIKKNKKVFGLKQRVCDYSHYHPSFSFEDLLKGEYSSIKFDEGKQIYYLEQIVNGKTKKGLIGVTFNWHFYSKGWWIWGYPNLKIVVNVPCTYDDLEIIDDKYIRIKKDGKYGLIKYGFNKSTGDYYNDGHTLRTSDAYCEEIAPCIYDSLTKLGDNFVGDIDGEKKIITDYKDEKTKKFITIENKYKEIKLLSNNIYLCELETGKKEVLLIKPIIKYWKFEPDECIISRINPCDDAEIINSEKQYNCLLKVKNGNNISAYCINEQGKFDLVEENILDVSYDSNSQKWFIQKSNGHIKVVDELGNDIFNTENFDIQVNDESKDLSLLYIKELKMFKVLNNNLIKMFGHKNQIKTQTFEDRTYKSFDIIKLNYNLFVEYIEQKEDKEEKKFARLNMEDEKIQEIDLLKGNFQIEDIINNKRLIFSTLDSSTNLKKLGVIEIKEGNVCIDCIYDSIQFDYNNNLFVCTKDNIENLFDIDGFAYEDSLKYKRGYREKTPLLKFKI